MQPDTNVSRRVFLGAMGAMAVAPRSFAQAGPPDSGDRDQPHDGQCV